MIMMMMENLLLLLLLVVGEERTTPSTGLRSQEEDEQTRKRTIKRMQTIRCYWGIVALVSPCPIYILPSILIEQ